MLTRITRRVRDKLQPSHDAPEAPAGPTPRQQRLRQLTESVVRESTIDAERFARYSVPIGGNGRYAWMRGMRLDASATRLYHRVEKGLVLPQPRRPFGVLQSEKIRKVLGNPHAKPSSLYVAESHAAIDALERWNETGEIDERVAPLADSLPGNPVSAADAAAFMTSRHSVRHFAPDAVDRALIGEAVRVAMSAPSVCNRQSWRAHWFDSAEDLARLMPLHSGSGGFGDTVPGLFVLTYDLRTFEGAAERNQGWIDAGMFAQNLLLALHSLGLGAVPLNWSRFNRMSDTLREAAAIPAHENVVMLVGVGHPAPGHRVARSTRRPVEQILRFGSR